MRHLFPRSFQLVYRLKTPILGSVTLVATAALAQSEGDTCHAPDLVTQSACIEPNSNLSVVLPTGANTERAEDVAGSDFEEIGFSLSIEEVTVAGATKPSVVQRVQDRALETANVQVKFDGLDIQPRLNVATHDLRASYQAGEGITFRASTNYPFWISRAEVVIIDRASRTRDVVETIPISPNGQVMWAMPQTGSGKYAYVLRVYDAKGRFNETAQLNLNRTDAFFATHETRGGPLIAAGEGEDNTAVSKIPMHGGSITTSGEGVPPGSRVEVMGETVPVDSNGRFVSQRVLPPGEHFVSVKVHTEGRGATDLGRHVEIPEDEWFYVAIADVTVAKKIEDELEDTLAEDKGTDVDGRLAFYLKGRIKGSTLITASADTGEGDIEDVFRRLDEKDPRSILRRLDPEDTYLVYGDDSSAYDDTPTSGRFYIRVQRDASSVLWGDFDADVSSGQLVNNNRRLYGLQLKHKSKQVTSRGDSRFNATLYAAQPDTKSQRDVLQGTGGSAYFLSREDINFASENIRVEIKDRDTGRVIERRNLIEGRDYAIDYIQGVLILTDPLNSSRSTGPLVTENPIGDTLVSLVVDYEYTPGISSVDGSSAGGVVDVWATDALNLRFTGLRDTTDTADVELLAATVQYNFGQHSWIEGEVARSKGTGVGANFSTDGGLSYSLIGSTAPNTEGNAYRIETYIDFEDVGSARPGDLNFYIERRDAGFSTLTQTFAATETISGFTGTYHPRENLELRYAAENLRRSTGEEDSEAVIEVAYSPTKHVTVEGGISYSDQTGKTAITENGSRTDLGLRLTYSPNIDQSFYVFGQATLDASQTRSDNNRVGVGASVRVTEKLSADVEVSGGTNGAGALAKLTYETTPDNQVYFGYTLDPSRTLSGSRLTGRDKGVFVAGAKYRYNEQVSSFAEHKYDLFGDRKSVTEAYGVTYTPDNRWTYTGGFEVGRIADPNDLDFDRTAVSFGVGYVDGDVLKGKMKLEYRTEDGEGQKRDRDTWLLSGALEYKHSEEWRLLSTVDAVVSRSDETTFRDGRYVELSLGSAFRPITNEKINALFKLTYLDDQPGEDQVNADDIDFGSAQKSIILSADLLYDYNQFLTFGVKYGYRNGKTAPGGTRTFSDSTAHLLVLGAEWHVTHKWDIQAEVRQIYTEETRIRERGALLAVYRHVSNNAKIGIGYEVGSVTDNLSKVDYDSSGVFINLVAKF